MKYSCSSLKHCVCTAVLMTHARMHTHIHNLFLHGTRVSSGRGPPHYGGFTITVDRPLWTRDRPDAETST